jgi:hypothetical protein
VTQGLKMPQIAPEFVYLQSNRQNHNPVDVHHPTQGSNTDGETDVGKGRCEIITMHPENLQGILGKFRTQDL